MIILRILPLFFLSLLLNTVSAQCDAGKRPVVFMHGFLASGDTYAGQITRFEQAGYCADRLFVFDWNSIGANGKITDSLLSVFIDQVLAKTHAEQIDLVGHSAGGGLGRGYLMDSLHAAKVAHYVHLGSRKWFFEYNWFPNKKCLNIYSSADQVMGKMSGNVEGARNVDLMDKDHYEVATSEQTFNEMKMFLNDAVVTPSVKARTTPAVKISGKAVLLGDNAPMQHARADIFRVSASGGERTGMQPDFTFLTAQDGRWGPFTASAKVHYEIMLTPADSSQRVVSYFFEPFRSSDAYVYLRGFPKGNLVANMLGSLPKKEDQSVIVVFSANHAVLQGRDTLAVNGWPLSPAMPASRTVISTFIYDDGDGKSSGKTLKQFSAAPFISGADILLPAGPGKKNIIYFNGRQLVLPAVSSRERILLAVFN